MKYALLAGFVLGVLGAGAFYAATWLAERKQARVHGVRVVPVAFRKDAAALRLGKYLFESRGCGECHGMDGGGRVLVNEPGGLLVRTPNLTAGRGSAVAAYTEADWVRAIRHGVAPNGRALLIMPSEDYNRLHDADLAALVSHIRALPPLDGEPGEIRMPPVMKALYGVGAVHAAAERIDHRVQPPAPVPVAITAEHGAYVAAMCLGCHGEHLSGGKIPGMPSEWPPAANLTPGSGSGMARYDTPEKFAAMMRSGKRPDGTTVSAVMPFASFAKMDDTDLAAMHAYLRSLPPRAAGGR